MAVQRASSASARHELCTIPLEILVSLIGENHEQYEVELTALSGLHGCVRDAVRCGRSPGLQHDARGQ